MVVGGPQFISKEWLQHCLEYDFSQKDIAYSSYKVVWHGIAYLINALIY